MANKNSNCADAQMMIRKPVSEVFGAFIDPAVTKNFWFTKSSGKLEVNVKVTWEWEMYKVSVTVVPKEIIQNERISFDWNEPTTRVEFIFKAIGDQSTLVTVTECGYDKSGDELMTALKNSTGGFTTVLDGLKAFLEHGINLNLILDKYPKE
ncbi:MAG TPA: SRPBCC family protein [Chitinophagaceae bacterium]|nr:SRPBCC family protein [Chitinophagaceae bacterium]